MNRDATKTMTTLTLILLSIGVMMAQPGVSAENKHPQEHVEQFKKQCMDATDNPPLCACAAKAFRELVPADHVLLDDEQNLTIIPNASQDVVDAINDAVAECEAKHAKKNE